MPADFTIKQGAIAPGFADTLTRADGTPVNLTGATVTFTMRSLTSSQPLALIGTVTITSPGAGQVLFVPSTADTALSGQYMANWLVTLSGSTQPEPFPTSGYLWVSIEPSLAQTDNTYLVSLPDVKDYLNDFGIDRKHDGKLLSYVQAATPVIENIVGPVIVRTIEEWHDGGQYWITLRRKPSFALGTSPVLQILGCDEYRGPIKSPLSVITDPTAAGVYSCMLDQRTGTLYRRSTGGGVIPFGAGAWGGGMPQAVHVVYQTGQATVPANVRMATLEAIREFYQNTMPTGSGSRSLADTFDTGSTQGFATYLDRYARGALAPMRRHASIA